MSNSIFYSWQSDTSAKEGHNLIERSLKDALQRIAKDATLEESMREGLYVDKDTKGTPGSPAIFNTILEKITRANVFVPDLTFTGMSVRNKPMPNSNVLIEYGWALKEVGHSRIVAVMNEAHGKPTRESMPFNLGQYRFPITYNLADNASDIDRRAARAKLTENLVAALKAVFESGIFPTPIQLVPYESNFPQAEQARFRSENEELGILRQPFPAFEQQEATKVYLSKGPVMWLRLMPKFSPKRTWLISDLEKVIRPLALMPLTTYGMGGDIGFVRASDGCGYFPIDGGKTTNAISFIFRTGEVWIISAYLVWETQTFELDEDRFIRSVEICAEVLEQLGNKGPYRWIAGIDGIKNWYLALPQSFNRKKGPCIASTIVTEGEYERGQNSEETLKGFFEQVFDECGTVRMKVRAT